MCSPTLGQRQGTSFLCVLECPLWAEAAPALHGPAGPHTWPHSARSPSALLTQPGPPPALTWPVLSTEATVTHAAAVRLQLDLAELCWRSHRGLRVPARSRTPHSLLSPRSPCRLRQAGGPAGQREPAPRSAGTALLAPARRPSWATQGQLPPRAASASPGGTPTCLGTLPPRGHVQGWAGAGMAPRAGSAPPTPPKDVACMCADPVLTLVCGSKRK